MSTNLNVRLLVAATVTALCAVASAQFANEDKVHQGYYFWDFSVTDGEATITAEPRPYTGSGIPYPLRSVSGTVKYSIQSMEYSYDFCGSIPVFVTLGGQQIKIKKDSTVTDVADNTYNLEGRESKSANASIGVRFRTGNAADLFLRGGVTMYEDDEIDALGSSNDERMFSEIGFRSRVGPYRNLELYQTVRDDEDYGVRATVGMRYHAAAGFVIGVQYSENRRTTFLSSLIPNRPAMLALDDHYSASFSLRFDI